QLDSVYADPANLAESPTSYMLGDQFLVAPVLEPGAQRLNVALPVGRLWSGSTFEVASAAVRSKSPRPLASRRCSNVLVPPKASTW
ncbi:hypothetical protein P3W53_04785, partial [Pseudomonas denitrificans (nom. rej.)]|nr:hypothetical protein [Pseudomonas denitrificans (nom. rej.)]